MAIPFLVLDNGTGGHVAAMLNVTHDSQNEFYRCPVGAAPTESKVVLRLRLDTHEKITCVKGSYHKTITIIEKLREKNISVDRKSVV